MNREEQQVFVAELLSGIEDDICAAIERGVVPDTWDGVELREYIYEKALRARANHLLTGLRGREYRNTLTVTPL